MFKPTTKRIERLGEIFPEVILELENIFSGNTYVYIDWANVIHWQERLGWHINLKRLKQFFNSFDTVKITRLYVGTLKGNNKSEESIKEASIAGYDVKTKPVKLMKMSINASSIPNNSPALLEQFIKKGLLSMFNRETIEFLNGKLLDLNRKGIIHIEDMKCNFDVEIGRDMLLDFDKNNVDNFILWSGDSDFASPIMQLMQDSKKVYLFATAREISRELNGIKVLVFDIKKIKEFICFPREISQSLKGKIDQ